MCVGGGSKSCIEFIFRKLCNLKGGPYISTVVRKFQCISEILVPGGTILGGSKFIMTAILPKDCYKSAVDTFYHH